MKLRIPKDWIKKFKGQKDDFIPPMGALYDEKCNICKGKGLIPSPNGEAICKKCLRIENDQIQNQR